MITITTQILNHLEFFGYTTESIEPKNKKEKQIFIARHAVKNNLVFFELAPSFLMFRVNLTTERKHHAAMDVAMNEINKVLTISKIYYEIETDKATLRIEAVYIGEYIKERFGVFLDLFINDQNKMYESEHFKTAFLGTDPITS